MDNGLFAETQLELKLVINRFQLTYNIRRKNIKKISIKRIFLQSSSYNIT